ncbi:MAG TPA: HAMP domain-containing sensor histidine kinase [Gaiellaceae bacterium]|nr:HAMP domain-containing sensor histidine kinase [Gaiellaceae bacterium]
MRAIAWSRRNATELAWGAFAAANLVAMIGWETWETIPFHFIWVSLTLVYGFRIWRAAPMVVTLATVCVATGIVILVEIHDGAQAWGELTEVPLMSAMFLAMVWHARRRQQALQAIELLADERASLLERQKRFVHDASHELRTPVTIARGHLEVFERSAGRTQEIEVALDELARIEHVLERLLLLAKAEHPDFVTRSDIDMEPFLEDVFLRWSGAAERPWRLGHLPVGTLRADPETLRSALDALLENAVKYTDVSDPIKLSATASGDEISIVVADRGSGIARDAVDRIFERFSRADPARTRAEGGVGLGLAIVDTIAKAHGGRCTVETSEDGSSFALHLPGFRPRAAHLRVAEPSPSHSLAAHERTLRGA